MRPITTPTKKKPERWNAFKNPPIKKNTGSMEESKYIDFFLKVFKLFAYLVTFTAVLGSAVVSKGTLLFMISQITPNRTLPYCNKALGIHKEFVVTLPRTERVAWMWVILFSYFVPELGTFIRSLRICLFKKWEMPTTVEIIFLFVVESLPAVGSAILAFNILPELDVLKGAMLTNAVCFVPAVTGFFSGNRTSLQDHGHEKSMMQNICSSRNISTILDILAILAQATAFIVWPMMEGKPSLWLIPLSVILISFGWLENYISHDFHIAFTNKFKYKKSNERKKVNHIQSDTENKNIKSRQFSWKFENSRYFIYLFLSIWKCILFFTTTLLIIWIKEGSVNFFFKEFGNAFEAHSITITEIKPIISNQTSYNIEDVIHVGGSVLKPADHLVPIWVFIINVGATYICYAFGKFACKIMIQGFAYAFPINLAVPATITSLIVFCGLYNLDPCAFRKTIPSYLFFNGPGVYFLSDFFGSQQSWIWLLWLLSQTWITIHLWSPSCEKLAKTEKLYVKPMYDAFLVDQSIAMNRRRDDQLSTINNDEDYQDCNASNNDLSDMDCDKTTKTNDETTVIYACATMWHETKEEMLYFLKSIMRLDEDQYARRVVKEQLPFDVDYYTLETHIFFDDAFIRVNKDDNDPQLNEWVQTLVLTVNEAINEAYPTEIIMKLPGKCSTPYGGRLEWTLPGQTKMIAHLKDKKQIRVKKRWSQVMYMYYLLGHRLMGQKKITPQQKDMISENTFILALDGDIDFQPDAVHRLVELMKKNVTLGAACGRIHPLGSGPMVWYQIFEYSVGHWLQKATEHMIGCVLCSPGCFSLFKAKALMDDNVMAKYTLKSEQARHFVQYDQGEDRWLCTLLLQRGYRVEYCAASDSYTHCPEKFIEFYNQRRRWMPSTTANILDLLIDYERTIKMNDNISIFYIYYQAVLMGGTVLGPGTIFLMLVGSFVAAFQMSQWSSFCWNAFPIVLFMAICYWCKSDIQIFFAGLLSAVYGLVMVAVLVGVILQMTADGPLAPSSLFFYGVAGQFIITAILHPKEMWNLKYGPIYYVSVPSMYLFLVIYSIFNLNDISWGTRDVTVVENKTEQIQEKNRGSNKNPKQNTVMNFFGTEENKKKTGSFEFSFAGLFTCMLCTHAKQPEDNAQLMKICSSLDRVSSRLDEIEKLIQVKPEKQVDIRSQQSSHITILPENSTTQDVYSKAEQTTTDSTINRTEVTPSPNTWMDDETLGDGHYIRITKTEKNFWEKLITEFLSPVDERSAKIDKDLKDLRDNCVMGFIMLNFIFVLVIFLLTLNKDILHINWPFDVKVNFTYVDDSREIKIYKQYLQLEPIGFVFLIFFGLILCVQFTAMLFHRFGTFMQILACTYINLNCFTQLSKKPLTAKQRLENDPVKGVKKLIKSTENKEVSVGRRKTVRFRALESEELMQEEINDLEGLIRRRETMAPNRDTDGDLMAAFQQSRQTFKLLNQESQT